VYLTQGNLILNEENETAKDQLGKIFCPFIRSSGSNSSSEEAEGCEEKREEVEGLSGGAAWSSYELKRMSVRNWDVGNCGVRKADVSLHLR